MQPRKDGKFRKAPFSDGFCYAFNKKIVEEVCPVDLNINSLGYGLEVFLGYQAMRHGKYVIIDHGLQVSHPHTTGYNSDQARIQRDRWFQLHEKQAQLFYKMAHKKILRNKIGYWLTSAIVRKTN